MVNIAIIGAGINGLVLGICLRRLGFPAESIQLYEKAQQARAEGTGIIFWSEAVAVLKQLGIAVDDRGVCLPRVKTLFLKSSGDPLVFDIQKAKGQEAYGFLRGQIYDALFDEAKRCGLQIRTGCECLSVSEAGDNCIITFKNSTKQADVVIGCDGIQSVVRQSTFPDIMPIPLNISAYRGTYVASREEVSQYHLPEDSCYIYCGANSRIILYPNFFDKKTSTTSYYWFAAHRTDPKQLELHAANRPVTEDDIETLLINMPRCPEDLQAVFRHTDRQKIIRSSTLRQLPYFDYTQGRIALLGDAGQAMAPTAGLGFMLGLLNSLVLAASLHRYRDDMPQALRQYQELTKAHTQGFLDYTQRLTASYYVADPLGSAQAAKGIYDELFQLTAQAKSTCVNIFQQQLNFYQKNTHDSAIAPLQTFFSSRVEQGEDDHQREKDADKQGKIMANL